MTFDENAASGPLVNHEIPRELTNPERGGGNYPPYSYLWHLGAAGILDLRDLGDGDYEVGGGVWFSERLGGTKPARIALIDTGLADHPNLGSALLRDLSVDLGSHPGGAVYPRPGEEWAGFLERFGLPVDEAQRGRLEPRTVLSNLEDAAAVGTLLDRIGVDLPASRRRALVDAIAHRIGTGVVLRNLSAQDQRYPSHGTASAGLLVGSPVFTPTRDPAQAEFAAGTLPFFGVDPWSELFSIATSFEPEPMQLTLALLYAAANGADVIHMPRGTDNPGRGLRPDLRRDPPRTRYDGHAEEWDLFEAVLLAVSRRIPVVCAAGNSGDDRLRYPASVAATADAPNGIIATGAVTALGRRAGYANYGPGLTLVAPSNDSRVYTCHQMRLDPRDRTASSHNWAIHHRLDGGYVEFSHQAPLSLDIPGPRGYRGGVVSRRQDAVRSDYTLFGGTSAASAIVAGIAALMCRAAPDEGPGRGVRIKSALVSSARREIAGKRLTPDISNRSDLAFEPQALFGRLFGAGVVHAGRAVEEICRPA